MLASLKRKAKRQMQGRPGHRFQDRYERAQKQKAGSGMRRIVNISLAIVAFVVGVTLLVIPGPGLPILVIGGALLASESRWAARFLDWAELKLRALWKRAHKWWQQLSTPGMVSVIGAAAGVVCVGAYAFWRVWRG